MPQETISRSLARFVYGLSYDTLPAVLPRRVKNLILDALGTAIAGRDMHSSRMAVSLLKDNRGDCSVFGHRAKVPALDAVFVNAVLLNALAMEDFLFSLHPGQVNVPTAFAVAEQESRSGKELITALVAGYEVMGRVYLGGRGMPAKFRGTPVFGPFGAAAAAGKLLKLNEDQLTSALGFTANFAGGLTQCWLDGTMEGNFHAGVAARNGITAAMLAKAGAIASEKALEGDCGFYQAFSGSLNNAGDAVSGLGERFLIMETCYKPYPVCAFQQIPIEMISRLVNQHNIAPNSIRKVVEKVSSWEAAFPGGDFAGPFESFGQALLSSQFCAAAALLGRPVESPRFYMESYNDTEVLSLARKVTLVGEPERKVPEITVTLNNGETYRIEEDEAEGTLIPTDQKIITKFNGLTSDLIRREKAVEIIDQVMSLEELRNIRELTDRLREV